MEPRRKGRGARPELQHLERPLESRLGFPEVVGRAQRVAELAPGPGLEVRHLAVAVGGGIERLRHVHRHPRQAHRLPRIFVAHGGDAVEEGFVDAEAGRLQPSGFRVHTELSAVEQGGYLASADALLLQLPLQADRPFEGAGHRLVVG